MSESNVISNIGNDFPVHIDMSPRLLRDTQALVTFGNSVNFLTEDARPQPLTLPNSQEIQVAPWGADNLLPVHILETIGKNPVATICLQHKKDVTYGGGVEIGTIDQKGKFVRLMPSELQAMAADVLEWMEQNNISRLLQEVITDLHWFGQAFVELILDRELPERRKILYANHREATFSRLSSADKKTGKVEWHLYMPDWNRKDIESLVVTPILWSKSPIRELKMRIGRIPDDRGRRRDEEQYRYILPLRLPSPGRFYYPKPAYFSIIESGWLDLANAIPEAKRSIMQQSLHIKFHVQINQDYFPHIFKKLGLTSKEEQERYKEKTFQEIEDFLKGAKNAGKTWFTYFHMTPDGKEEIPDIKIQKVDAKIGGEYIDDSHEASSMIYTAFGVHPNLIGVIPGKNAANLSGSDKRELLRIEQSLQKPIRDVVLQVLYMVKAINGWHRDLHFAFSDIVLTTLDQGRETTKMTVA